MSYPKAAGGHSTQWRQIVSDPSGEDTKTTFCQDCIPEFTYLLNRTTVISQNLYPVNRQDRSPVQPDESNDPIPVPSLR